jgi:hypothetical protein
MIPPGVTGVDTLHVPPGNQTAWRRRLFRGFHFHGCFKHRARVMDQLRAWCPAWAGRQRPKITNDRQSLALCVRMGAHSESEYFRAIASTTPKMNTDAAAPGLNV